MQNAIGRQGHHHAYRGAAMTSKPVARLVASLRVVPGHFWPRAWARSLGSEDRLSRGTPAVPSLAVLPTQVTRSAPWTRRQPQTVLAVALLASLALPAVPRVAHAHGGSSAVFGRVSALTRAVEVDPATPVTSADLPHRTAVREDARKELVAQLSLEHRAEIEHLIEKATRAGTVNVIVGLRLDDGYTPEALLPGPGAIARQRAAIAQARDALLASLRTVSATEYARWDTLPSVALRVDAAALRLLAETPLITAIQEDSLSRPQ